MSTIGHHRQRQRHSQAACCFQWQQSQRQQAAAAILKRWAVKKVPSLVISQRYKQHHKIHSIDSVADRLGRTAALFFIGGVNNLDSSVLQKYNVVRPSNYRQYSIAHRLRVSQHDSKAIFQSQVNKNGRHKYFSTTQVCSHDVSVQYSRWGTISF